MDFKLHDEEDHEAAARFLDGWLPVALRGLTALLGNPAGTELVHVVLSTTAEHERRFPAQDNDVTALFGPADEDAFASPANRLHTHSYAHGVTTLSMSSHRPPADIAVGDTVVYLDVPTIARLASEHDVLEEAMLGRVAIHELSHVVRGHANHDGRATHGYIREGDAQRDTWQVLADLLADADTRQLAREGRAAQVKLSSNQPPAYRQFGHASPDTDRWADHKPVPAAKWTLRAARALLPLSQSAIIEVPIFTSSRVARPSMGDEVYLLGDNLIVGPWIVLGRTHSAYVAHDVDLSVIDRESRDRQSRSALVPEWLHLRRTQGQRAGRDPHARLSIGVPLVAKRVDSDDIPLLRATLTSGADDLFEALANQKLDENETGLRKARESLRAMGAVISEDPADAQYDPFSD